MGIDVRTMILIIGISHMMQVMVFLYQYIVSKNIKGPGWFLTWSAAEMLGFVLMFMRNILSLLPIIILTQNFILLFGTIAVYIGIQRFYNKAVNWKFMGTVFIIFSILHVFFYLNVDDIKIRTLCFNAALAIIGFYTARSIFRNKSHSTIASANFIMVLVLIHACVFTYRAIIISLGRSDADYTSPDFFNLIQYYDAFIIGLLWTFGFILLINQKLNAEVSEARDKFVNIFETSPDAIALCRIDDAVLVDCNESYEKIIGFTKEEIIGKSLMDFKIWENPADRETILRKVRDDVVCLNFETSLQSKSGNKIICLISAKAISLNDVPHLISVIRDISNLKQAQDEIRLKNEELLMLNNEKDKFYSIIAHDLKSPFNSILGFSELLVEQARNNEIKGIEKYSEIIYSSSKRAFDLLSNLMEWSKSQTGTIMFEPEVFQFNNYIEETLKMSAILAQQKSIIIRTEIPDDIIVFADKAMISTIFRNLIANAIKFTNPGGEVVISLKKQQDNQTFIISDNGVGIPTESIEHLFRIDKKFTTRGTQNEPGTGFGLILCKEFIEKHSGKIWVESEQGKGTRFLFTIPGIIDK